MTLKKSLLIPLGVFIALCVMLALGFGLKDPHQLPSVLIDRPFPEFSLQDLHDDARTRTGADLPGELALVNVWATWCAGCLVEHPELMRIAGEEGIPIIGVNYSDDAEKARAWLVRYGDPYKYSVSDTEGVLAIDLGVYGAPETFVVDASGVIRFRFVGPVTRDVWNKEFVPVLRSLQGGDSA